MDRNKRILDDWKLVHDKGMLAYVIPYSLRFLIAMAAIATVIFLVHRPNNTNTISSVIANNSILFAVVTLARVFEWFKREKQYKAAIKLLELINRCPMCSAKTSSADKICSSCGIILGIEDNKK